MEQIISWPMWNCILTKIVVCWFTGWRRIVVAASWSISVVHIILQSLSICRHTNHLFLSLSCTKHRCLLMFVYHQCVLWFFNCHLLSFCFFSGHLLRFLYKQCVFRLKGILYNPWGLMLLSTPSIVDCACTPCILQWPPWLLPVASRIFCLRQEHAILSHLLYLLLGSLAFQKFQILCMISACSVSAWKSQILWCFK